FGDLQSQRDLSVSIPVNFATVPGVSLSAACFSSGNYVTNTATKCFSNLLALGYRRFVSDVYWDTGRLAWNFCPAQIPAPASSPISEFSSSSSVTVSTAQFTVRAPSFSQEIGFSTFPLLQRQATSTSRLESSTSPSARTSSSSSPASSATGRNATQSSSPSSSIPSFTSNGDMIFELGPFNCSSSLDLVYMVSIMSDYLGKSSNTLQAFTIYLTLNLHAAAPQDDPDGAADTPDDSSLPDPSNLLSNIMNTNASSFLYTPQDLNRDRTNLNDTWYHVDFRKQPDPEYYQTDVGSGNVRTTPNGWPSDSYVEFQKAERLMVGFGSVDPQMTKYNFSGDEHIIFPRNYLFEAHNVAYGANGSIVSGCFKGRSDSITSAKNNSWAVSEVQQRAITLDSMSPSNATLPAIKNLTACGASPFLNTTLLGKTADSDFSAYGAIPRSTIWSWGPGEPRNVSSSDDNSDRIRCAVLDLSLQGHWRVEDCNKRHNSACRVNKKPYEWHISGQKSSYSSSAQAGCGDNEAFSAPRTGLENAYLFDAFSNSDHDSDLALWVDFNSLDRDNCWVVGLNTSCPYVNDSDAERTRFVVVPTVAAVIVFILAVLTLFVKCAANRQNSRRGRRRRGEDGWDYEGVPS
ncbi:hypothetical protein NA57DRAFT_34163, partial [Rhizodiscina lignyota]